MTVATVRIFSVSDAISSLDEPRVLVKAKTDSLDDENVTVAWTYPAGLAPHHGERWRIRLDWIDRNAEVPNGVQDADEARAWIRAHPDEVIAMVSSGELYG